MDLSKVGKFIQERRKAKKLTQVQLAQKIGVSEKTISKWECGKGFPDTTLMLPLCKVLNISSNELLSGKILEKEEEYRKTAEENILNLTKQENYKNKLLLTLEWVIGYFAILVWFICIGIIVSSTNISQIAFILILIFGFINICIGITYTLRIEKSAGYYECKHCQHRHIPTYNQIFWSIHIGRSRYIKCPKCHKNSWHKKKINND